MARPNVYIEFCCRHGCRQKDIHETLIRLLKAYRADTLFYPYAAITTGPNGEDYELKNVDENTTLKDVFEWIAKYSGDGGGAINLLWSGLEYRDLGLSYGLVEHPDGQRWHLSLSFNVKSFEEGEEPFCEDVVQLAKEIACELPVNFAFADEEFWFGIFRDRYRNEFHFLEENHILKEIPISEGSTPWFYILDKERYELSKPFLADLPIKLMEELPNGGVYLFVDYPSLHYDEIRKRKAIGLYPEFGEHHYQPVTERGRATVLTVLIKVKEALKQEFKIYSEEVAAFKGGTRGFFELIGILERRSCIEGYLKRLREHGMGWLEEVKEVREKLWLTDWMLQLIAYKIVPEFWEYIQKEREGRRREEWWWYLDEVIENPKGKAGQAAKKAVGKERFLWD